MPKIVDELRREAQRETNPDRLRKIAEQLIVWGEYAAASQAERKANEIEQKQQAVA